MSAEVWGAIGWAVAMAAIVAYAAWQDAREKR